MSKRNPAIELYRCILMFGICLLHCLHRDNYGAWAESLLLPCVAMDIPRRLLVYALKSPLDGLCRRVDGWYERIVG